MTDPSRLITRALDTAERNAKALARRMGISDTALRRYGYGDRTPPTAILSRLARHLRQQATALQRVAGALEKLARQQIKAGWRRPWGRPRGKKRR
jgi:uncharacterized membrane protein YccC